MDLINMTPLQLSHRRSVARGSSRPFPSWNVPAVFQSESWCIAFHMKMSFHSHADKTHFHMKGFARGLALKKRHKTIQKWPTDEQFRTHSPQALVGRWPESLRILGTKLPDWRDEAKGSTQVHCDTESKEKEPFWFKSKCWFNWRLTISVLS